MWEETERWDDQCPLLQAPTDFAPSGWSWGDKGRTLRKTDGQGLECWPGTWVSLTLTYQGPCSLRLSDSLIQEACPVSQIWSGCSDLENTLPNPTQSCGKKPYAVLRLRIKKKFFSFGKGSSSHFEPSPSSSPCQLPTMYFQPILESQVAFRRCSNSILMYFITLYNLNKIFSG